MTGALAPRGSYVITRSGEPPKKREGLKGRFSEGPPAVRKPRPPRPKGAKTEAGEPTSSRVTPSPSPGGRSGAGGGSHTARLQLGQSTERWNHRSTHLEW